MVRILTDDKLRKVFGKDKVTMFEMNKPIWSQAMMPARNRKFANSPLEQRRFELSVPP
jgi:chromatin remodeling complex protein RSC6